MTAKESEESALFRMEGIPGGHERFAWIKKPENVYDADKWRTSATLFQLYSQAKYCHVNECYRASAGT
ncbi:MAG: hypothetical protein KAR39_07145 [Thermoplasmata archaeon]|nr:hypothetical protein [Thermoplasmata archaeon]